MRSGPNFDGRQFDVQRAVAAALDNAVAAERERLRALVEAVRDANRDAEDGDTFRLLKPGQERAWLALLAGLKGPNVELSGHQRPARKDEK